MKKENFPLFITTSGKKILVVGCGKVATRRILSLLNFNFSVVVVAKKISEEIKTLNTKDITLIEDSFSEDIITKDYYIVIAATNDRLVNHTIYKQCKKLDILVSVADKKEECTFYFPGIINTVDTTIGVVGSGENHKKTKEIIDKIREEFK